MTYDHPSKQKNGVLVMKRRILDIRKYMRVDSRMSIYNRRKPKAKAVGERAGMSTASYIYRSKKLDTTIATDDQAMPFIAAYQSYGEGGPPGDLKLLRNKQRIQAVYINNRTTSRKNKGCRECDTC